MGLLVWVSSEYIGIPSYQAQAHQTIWGYQSQLLGDIPHHRNLLLVGMGVSHQKLGMCRLLDGRATHPWVTLA